MNYRIKKVTNELNQGTTVFSYDQFSNLVSAKESGVEAVFRTMDCAGNLYETADQRDCIYGAGSRLERSVINLNEKRNRYQGGQGKLVTKGFSFCYDEEGNLAKKIEPNGDTWSYIYYGNGMLKEVTRPNQSNVGFKYDPFGRRIEKNVTAACGDKIPQKKQRKVVRFLWDGNALLHEWEEKSVIGSQVTDAKVSYRADYVLKLKRGEEEKAREEAQKGKKPPEGLITWVFQDDFIPRGKITKEGNYSIISDYLGTPVEAYDETGEKVWEQELDIYGRVKSRKKDMQVRTEREACEGNFIPFRFQGQYADEETGLYYNRFRYYSPEDGCYTQQDPIGLAGGNPTLYGYVFNPLYEIDPLGLEWKDLLGSGLGHHLFPRSIAKKLGIEGLSELTAIAWYPNITANTGILHQKLHNALSELGVPFHGSKYTGSLDDFWKVAEQAYDGFDVEGYLKIPYTDDKLFENLTPKQALEKIKELQEKGELPIKNNY